MKLYILLSLVYKYSFIAISTPFKNLKKNAKTSKTRFGPGSGTRSAVSTDPDLGLAKFDPRIRVRIWILFLKMDLDRGPPGPDPDSTRCHT